MMLLEDNFKGLESDVVNLQSQTKSLSERLTFCENNVTSVADVCSEMRDREQRAKNVTCTVLANVAR